MRRLFSEYGLFMLCAVCGIMAFSLFTKVLFGGETVSLSSILKTWIGQLI